MKAVLLFILALSALSIQAQTKTDWQKQGLKGKVRSLKMAWNYRYRADGKNFTAWSAEDGSLINFSATGQATSIQYFKKGTTLRSTSKYIYKPATHEYEIKGYWPEGGMISSTVYKTDLHGNILEETDLDSAGIPGRTYKYTYDDKSNMLNYAGYNADGKLTGKATYSINAAGKKTAEKHETPGYATSYETYEYDANGNVSVEIKPGAAGLHSFRFERTYDDKNNMIRELKYIDANPKASLSTWAYEYDTHGNWIKQTEFSEEGEPFSFYERTIVYY